MVHNIGFNDFAQTEDDFSRQMQQAMAESQRQASAAFFSNPFGSMFGQGGFPFWYNKVVSSYFSDSNSPYVFFHKSLFLFAVLYHL